MFNYKINFNNHSTHLPLQPSNPFTPSTQKGFTIIEVVMVFLLILAVTFFILPKNLETTKHAKLISKWGEKYAGLEYMFSVINAQEDSEIKEKFHIINNTEGSKKVVLDSIKPYLRITSKVKVPYKIHCMNGSDKPSLGIYDFKDFYYTSLDEIVGLKLINPNCKKNEVCATISLDINGIQEPNIWGYDVFGINVFKNKIEPLGKGLDSNVLKYDCSKHGDGVYCSYYYLIGGKFD